MAGVDVEEGTYTNSEVGVRVDVGGVVVGVGVGMEVGRWGHRCV